MISPAFDKISKNCKTPSKLVSLLKVKSQPAMSFPVPMALAQTRAH